MTVKYEENNEGIYWVDGDQQGKPQKDLRHAMDDYELTQAGLKQEDSADEGGSDEGSSDSEGVRVHTGDDGRAARGGLIADNEGSAGESQEADAGGDEG
ncbi:hypothetical protein SEA_NOSHOW_48 [Mycobacterium phage NoShow]|nr:hypothetical protein SEA_NOSHOW_48 [Mycobacterium phage NoShow]